VRPPPRRGWLGIAPTAPAASSPVGHVLFLGPGMPGRAQRTVAHPLHRPRLAADRAQRRALGRRTSARYPCPRTQLRCPRPRHARYKGRSTGLYRAELNEAMDRGSRPKGIGHCRGRRGNAGSRRLEWPRPGAWCGVGRRNVDPCVGKVYNRRTGSEESLRDFRRAIGRLVAALGGKTMSGKFTNIYNVGRPVTGFRHLP
jgi:hypothetical protein